MSDDFEWQVPAHYSDPYFNLSVYKAASDVYEALKALVEYHQKYSGAIPCLADAIKALAKAEGKSQ